MSKDLYVWDFTLKVSDFNKDEKVLKDNLILVCKKWTFQLEEGVKSGYLHYQGRISLTKKKTLSSLISVFKEYPAFAGVHFSPCSNNAKGDVFYVIKVDTRVSGPWSDTDEIVYVPRQIREMKGLRPFQQHIVDNANVWDKRTINMIYCKKGNLGK
eukprot:COSAG02_NODE_9068_length_2342_cov_447.957200_1_plen_155_part_10